MFSPSLYFPEDKILPVWIKIQKTHTNTDLSVVCTCQGGHRPLEIVWGSRGVARNVVGNTKCWLGLQGCTLCNSTCNSSLYSSLPRTDWTTRRTRTARTSRSSDARGLDGRYNIFFTSARHWLQGFVLGKTNQYEAGGVVTVKPLAGTVEIGRGASGIGATIRCRRLRGSPLLRIRIWCGYCGIDAENPNNTWCRKTYSDENTARDHQPLSRRGW